MLLNVLLSLGVLAGPPGHAKKERGVPPGHAKKADGVPPGLAKKGGLPPGLAKKFGRRMPEKPYVAFDPKDHDRAWFLIDGKWQLKTGLGPALRAEVQDSLRLTIVAPPIPLPKIPGVELKVVGF